MSLTWWSMRGLLRQPAQPDRINIEERADAERGVQVWKIRPGIGTTAIPMPRAAAKSKGSVRELSRIVDRPAGSVGQANRGLARRPQRMAVLAGQLAHARSPGRATAADRSATWDRRACHRAGVGFSARKASGLRSRSYLRGGGAGDAVDPKVRMSSRRQSQATRTRLVASSRTVPRSCGASVCPGRPGT
jgi:hypothetical protein